MQTVYGRVAGIDVHKSMLAVAVGEAEQEQDQFQYRQFGTTRQQLEQLREWLQQQQVCAVVMESTAQYWKTVWLALEGVFPLQLAQARSVRGPHGRKSDFRDAARLVRRLISGDLILSYVPEAEQRSWRWLTRTRVQMTQAVARLYSHIEAVLEEGRIKLSGCVSDLLGLSGRRILRALASGQGNPREWAELRDPRLRATAEQLEQALEGGLPAAQQIVLKMYLDQLDLLEAQIGELERAATQQIAEHQQVVARLCEIPGMRVCAAHQVLAEVGPEASAFPSPAHLASWVGICPGLQESAGKNYSRTSPKGNRAMRRLLCQIAWAAVRTKGSRFQALFQRWVPRLGVNKALWAVAHRLCRVLWKVLHQRLRYLEHGPLALDPVATRRRTRYLTRELRKCGYLVELTPLPNPE